MKRRRSDALLAARSVQRAAARQGFDWPAGDPRAWRKLAEEIRELKAVAGNRRLAEEELGDLLFMVVNLSRHLRVDPERALRQATRKFSKRFAFVMGGKFPPIGDRRRLGAMEKRWQEAKKKGARD